MSAACTLAVKVIPGAPRDEVCGWLGDELKVKLHAPPLDGRANEALVELLAATLGVPRRDVVLVQGAKARRKVLRIISLDTAAVLARLPRR